MKAMIEVDIPDGADIDEAIYAVKRHFSPNWMCEWWHIDDVINQASDGHDKEITEDEAREVLRLMDDYHDCNIGHSWETMDAYIEHIIEQRKDSDE